MIFDKIENFSNYSLNTNLQDVFDFLIKLNPSMKERRYELGNNIFANIDQYNTKSSSQLVIESHLEYVDIQVIISGKELVKIFKTKALEIKQSYNSDQDVIFYNYTELAQEEIELTPGYFAIFLPTDGHMPQIKVDDAIEVKKVVIKVPIKLFK